MKTNQQLKTPNLLIYGETLIDEFPQQKIIGGAPFNVARSLSLFGARPLMLSRVGRDQNGEAILAECARTGLSADGIQIDDQHPSGRVLVELMQAADGLDVAAHRFEILNDQAYDYIDAEIIDDLLEKYFHEAPPDLIYFGSLIQRNEVSQSSLISLLEAEITEGASKFLDLNLRDEQASLETVISSLNYCDMVKLNEDELQYVIQHACPAAAAMTVDHDEAGLRLACEAVMAEYYMQAIIVTLGARGYFYLDANDVCLHSLDQPSAAVEVVDTVGAGDAFAAVFIYGWQSNWPIEKTLSAAHRFATAICGVRGAVADSLSFYSDWLNAFEATFARDSCA
ncbi:PfkB family carbohydrate kinase [Undibacterium flavidum]|uniref:Fructokinase n=1 Tax=Undibacterium flavidum TaxID=2762297 RepID=A0ABR6YDL0_9BURK|nr:PfkB family carbohydrate kinase [Undibacterium flavidum]MBC3874632.1 fructokinase [Undibacterium flavidum]